MQANCRCFDKHRSNKWALEATTFSLKEEMKIIELGIKISAVSPVEEKRSRLFLVKVEN